MKKLFILLALLFGVVSQSYAIDIPRVEDPGNGPAVWVLPVYNNDSGTLNTGDVVVWDIGSSTGKDDNYVKTTTTADTGIVAGIVYGSSIGTGSYGLIAVHGVVPINCIAGNCGTAGGLICTSGTANKSRSCTTEANSFGIVTTAAAAAGTGGSAYLRGYQ